MESDKITVESLEFQAALNRELADEFADFGYTVMRQDPQRWDIGYSLSRADTDGSVEVFFGPTLESQAEWRMPYEIIREGFSREGLLAVQKSVSPQAGASMFFHRISAELTNRGSLPDPAEPRGTASVSIERGGLDAEARENLAQNAA